MREVSIFYRFVAFGSVFLRLYVNETPFLDVAYYTLCQIPTRCLPLPFRNERPLPRLCCPDFPAWETSFAGYGGRLAWASFPSDLAFLSVVGRIPFRGRLPSFPLMGLV